MRILCLATAICLLTAALLSAASAQRPQPGAPAEITLTATSANVTEPGRPVRIRIFQWSTDEERTRLLAALNPPPPGAARAGGGGERGRAARGAPARGRGRGAPAVPQTPTALLTAAIGTAPTIGYIWTDAVTGYSIKYAWHTALSGGGERIVLATDRRLGGHLPGWKPAGETPPTDYEFTLIELRLDARGIGEGKTSLTTKVVADNDVRTLALENYAAAPAILQNVKRL